MGVLSAFNVTVVGGVQVENVKANSGALVDQLLSLGTVATGLIAIYGRLTAKAKLTGNDKGGAGI